MSHHTNKSSAPSQTSPSVATLEPPIARHSGCCDSTAPTHDEIAGRAYDLYVKSGCKKGHCMQNWNQAEQSLRNQSQAGHQAQQPKSGAFAPPSTRIH